MIGDSFGYVVSVIQGHKGRAVTASMFVSDLAVLEDGFLRHVCETLDRTLLDGCGHVDRDRLWVARRDVVEREWAGSARGPVWVLDGPAAGDVINAELRDMAIVGGPGAAGMYRVERLPGVAVATYQGKLASW